MKVFISSTYVDLVKYRKKAIDVMNHYQCLPLAMEFFDSLTQDAETVCETEIGECDIFIGIYAHRFGFIPKGKEKSISQQEYELAIGLGKDCLCFIVDKDHPWKLAFNESEKQKELKAFLDIVREQTVVTTFTDQKDFETKLSTSLGKLLAEKKAEPECKQKIMGKESYVPMAPLPYIAHPYALQANFTGRHEEMTMLSKWFFNETEPVLVLEAIGGMGKSALSWVWLQQEVLGPSAEVDGVFWWSFYDEPFESFIAHLACYVMGNEAKGNIDLAALTAALNHHWFLLVLDGLERVLRGYAGMEAMFLQEKGFTSDKEAGAEWDKRLREPVEPMAGRFLQALSTAHTRTLITTRLMPSPLERLAGVKHVELKGLSAEDTVRFLSSEGVGGTRAELEQAGRVYDFHPLMLKLLASAITRSRAKDIKEAFSINLIDQKEPHKILATTFNHLSKQERQVVTRLSVFRSVFTFDSAKALFPKKLFQRIKEKRLWEVMQELRNLGFLYYDEKQDRFDFHPIMRSFLYGQLTAASGTGAHTLAVQYFQALPEPEKVITLEDLAPTIELYHHLVKAGKCDEAYELFLDRIDTPTYYQLAAYHLQIELLKALFPKKEIDNWLPRLEKESDQARALNDMACVYSLSGQPAEAVPLYLMHNKLREKNADKTNLAIGLGALASVAQSPIGQISAVTAHLQKRIALAREIEDEFFEAGGHQELGRVLAFQGRAKCAGPCAEEEWTQSTAYWEKMNDYQGLSVDFAYRSLSALLQARLAAVLRVPMGEEASACSQGRESLDQARQALAFAGKDAETIYPMPRDFVQAYWLLGETLIQCHVVRKVNITPFEIPFYDEYFQQQINEVDVANNNELTAAERCLNEALRRCRKANMVESEPDILLALARLGRAKNLPPDENILKEAMAIAQRSGYRLALTDLHLFCGQTLLQLKDRKTLLGFSAREHLLKTKEYARDVSEFSHLHQSPNPDFYNGIPEYEMLKRGMTNEERILNGYWVAYQIAETLLKESPQNTQKTQKKKHSST